MCNKIQREKDKKEKLEKENMTVKSKVSRIIDGLTRTNQVKANDEIDGRYFNYEDSTLIASMIPTDILNILLNRGPTFNGHAISLTYLRGENPYSPIFLDLQAIKDEKVNRKIEHALFHS